jgi:DnaJ-like protein
MNDFYQILGIGRSARPEQIKSAYRELVKRYHPDLFATAGEKAKATERLRQINEAYAILGNPERRQVYDQSFVEQSQTRIRASATTKRAKPPRPQRQGMRQSRTDTILKVQRFLSKKRMGYVLGAAVAGLILIYASRSEPKIITAWTLMEKLDFSPSDKNASVESRQNWVALEQHASVSECSVALKRKVHQDEQEGSKSVFVERNGTMAVTVHVKTEAARNSEGSHLDTRLERSPAHEGTSTAPAVGTIKRVRNLECRATHRLETDSWLRRGLRKVGLVG